MLILHLSMDPSLPGEEAVDAGAVEVQHCPKRLLPLGHHARLVAPPLRPAEVQRDELREPPLGELSVGGGGDLQPRVVDFRAPGRRASLGQPHFPGCLLDRSNCLGQGRL